MYSLTFCVRFLLTEHHQMKPAVQAAAVMLRTPPSTIANPPNSAQLGGSLYHASKLHPGPCSSVGVRPRTCRQTHRHTHRRAWPQNILRRLRLTQDKQRGQRRSKK